MTHRLSVPCLVVASLLTACAHSFVTLDVRAIDTGKVREFTYEAKAGLLEASSSEGTLLRLWVHTKEIWAGDLHRPIPPGCHGGFLFRRRNVQEKADRTAVTLCPREGAPAGWQGWHVDFEQVDKRAEDAALPPAVLFDIQPSASGDELLVSTATSRVKVALPAAKAAAFRHHPELLGFSIITGLVPLSPLGTYETIER